MTQHTQEPWKADDMNNGHVGIFAGRWARGEDSFISPATPHIGYVTTFHGEGFHTTLANAARIVACVNACQGMADPVGEIGGMKMYEMENENLRRQLAEMTVERDRYRSWHQNAEHQAPAVRKAAEVQP